MRILFVAGGTVGTLSPLIAVAERVRSLRQNVMMHFVASPDSRQRALLVRAGFPVTAFTSGKLRRYFAWENIPDAFRVGTAFFRARRILRQLQPDMVASAGSFHTVPFSWAAKSMGIPVALHQQDIKIGLANRLSAPCSTLRTVAWEENVAAFGKKKAQYVGNPVRQEILDGDADRAASRFNIDRNRPVLLVIGGSSGARFLNELTRRTHTALQQHGQILHITGGANEQRQSAYVPVRFLEEGMGDVLALADLVVTRAGMNALTEIAAHAKAALVVPLPGTHQEANAHALARRRAAVVCPQDVLTDAQFIRLVASLLARQQECQQFGKTLQNLFPPDAAQKIAQLLLTLRS